MSASAAFGPPLDHDNEDEPQAWEPNLPSMPVPYEGESSNQEEQWQKLPVGGQLLEVE